MSPSLLLWSLLVVCAAQPHCDPTTQYEKEGRCCNRCGPGSSMVSFSSCDEPLCKECGDKEYQEVYTTATSCQRQPYCDPNKNFQVSVQVSKRRRSQCWCRVGFHCSSDECLTCVPHRTCPPGSGAQPKGNHSQDSVCVQCEHGWFSSEGSWDGVCQQWTTCGEGFDINQEGTRVSDVICAASWRSYIAAAVVSALLLVTLVTLVTVIMCYKQKGEAEYFKRRCQVCFSRQQQLQRDVEEGEGLRQEEGEGLQQEEGEELRQDSEGRGELKTPEENEDQPRPSMEVGVTVNGQLVVQEHGKTFVLPRQESQPSEGLRDQIL